MLSVLLKLKGTFQQRSCKQKRVMILDGISIKGSPCNKFIDLQLGHDYSNI